LNQVKGNNKLSYYVWQYFDKIGLNVVYVGLLGLFKNVKLVIQNDYIEFLTRNYEE